MISKISSTIDTYWSDLEYSYYLKIIAPGQIKAFIEQNLLSLLSSELFVSLSVPVYIQPSVLSVAVCLVL